MHVNCKNPRVRQEFRTVQQQYSDVYDSKDICVRYERYTNSRLNRSLRKRESHAVNDYNSELEAHYNSLSNALNATDPMISQQIANFYQGGFIPNNHTVPLAELSRLHMDPSQYTAFVANRELVRAELLKYSNFTQG